MTQDIDAILSKAQRPTQEHELCLRDDLRQQHNKLEAELTEARRAAGATMADNAKVRKLADKIKKLEGEMRSASLALTLQALERGQYRGLLRKHPPRDDDQADRHHGFNVDTFIPALIEKSVLEPKLSEQQWVTLFDSLSDGQLLDLGGACINLNQDAMTVPFSSAALIATRSSDSE